MSSFEQWKKQHRAKQTPSLVNELQTRRAPSEIGSIRSQMSTNTLEDKMHKLETLLGNLTQTVEKQQEMLVRQTQLLDILTKRK